MKRKYLAVMPIEGTEHRFPVIKEGEIIPAKSTIRSVEYKGYRWFHMGDLARVLKRTQVTMNDDTLEYLKDQEIKLGFFPVKEFDTKPLKISSGDFEGCNN